MWEHIIGLLADPYLIRALAKATTASTRMIEALSKQLITRDELRQRMPDLRARKPNLRNQIAALDTQQADHDHYLTLATYVEPSSPTCTTVRVHIPVPAIADEDTFVRVMLKLEDNKRFGGEHVDAGQRQLQPAALAANTWEGTTDSAVRSGGP